MSATAMADGDERQGDGTLSFIYGLRLGYGSVYGEGRKRALCAQMELVQAFLIGYTVPIRNYHGTGDKANAAIRLHYCEE